MVGLFVIFSCITAHVGSGANSRFASPAEYAPHALWLMRGAVSGACACKYCSKSQQKSITAAMEDAVIAARTAPSARRIKHSATPSPTKLKPVFTNPVKRTVPAIPQPTIDFLPTSTAPSLAVSNDAEFLRALKRRREDSSDIEEIEPPTLAMKTEEDELAEDNL
ncbi:hypothetical protein PENSPDRAFT_249021 [Peniophora sp. CONT]|nr:hypothetical protein PENSPDRAFT_249021 [Peniophora sp. CONT]